MTAREQYKIAYRAARLKAWLWRTYDDDYNTYPIFAAWFEANKGIRIFILQSASKSLRDKDERVTGWAIYNWGPELEQFRLTGQYKRVGYANRKVNSCYR